MIYANEQVAIYNFLYMYSEVCKDADFLYKPLGHLATVPSKIEGSRDLCDNGFKARSGTLSSPKPLNQSVNMTLPFVTISRSSLTRTAQGYSSVKPR